jgi:hypothetical protein
MKIIRTRLYERKIYKLLSEKELVKAEDEIASSPERWPVIAGTGGIRKARAARGNSGKSGGLRILYYLLLEDEMIYLLDVYAKNEQDNLSNAQKKVLRSLIEILQQGED